MCSCGNWTLVKHVQYPEGGASRRALDGQLIQVCYMDMTRSDTALILLRNAQKVSPRAAIPNHTILSQRMNKIQDSVWIVSSSLAFTDLPLWIPKPDSPGKRG